MAKTVKPAKEKLLNLVCKCGSCTHWEIISVMEENAIYSSAQKIKCISCNDIIPCSFTAGPHEGLHYEIAEK